MMLERRLEKLVRQGDLTVSWPGGRLRLGDGSGPPVGAVIRDRRTALRIALNPGLAVGEAWMDGTLTLSEGSIYDLLDVAGRNWRHRRRRPGPLALWWDDRLRQRNARQAARRNASHHYDLSLDLYRRFLDEDLQYSCAYFTDPTMSLEAAQAAKKRHIAAKLRLEPGQKVLDIGCGWGGLALTLAREFGATVDGVTLADEQLATAERRARDNGLDDRARFALTDYRDVAGPYDRIVSVGMFEHVGRPGYQAYFDTVARLLNDDGVAVIHAIMRAEGPAVTQPWIARYIFPGGYIPALSEVLPAVERAGLVICDVEILRLHYALTLRRWRERFEARRGEIATLYDERFCRMWEFYLAASEVAFRRHGHAVFQLQLAKRVDAVPITRDYITDADRASRPARAARPASRAA